MVGVLRTLSPETHEEVSHLQTILDYARSIYQGMHLDPSLGRSRNRVKDENMGALRANLDVRRFLDWLPRESRRHFDALMEALDIYQAIHGEFPVVRYTRNPDRTVHELRTIRDLCLMR